jgi:hypothetical protein
LPKAEQKLILASALTIFWAAVNTSHSAGGKRVALIALLLSPVTQCQVVVLGIVVNGSLR